jgi:hypothetical protein
MSLKATFQPNKSIFLFLSDKVKRSQRMDLDEFHVRANLSNFGNLREKVAQWQFFYN